jgi:hypothetical protein
LSTVIDIRRHNTDFAGGAVRNETGTQVGDHPSTSGETVAGLRPSGRSLDGKNVSFAGAPAPIAKLVVGLAICSTVTTDATISVDPQPWPAGCALTRNVAGTSLSILVVGAFRCTAGKVWRRSIIGTAIVWRGVLGEKRVVVRPNIRRAVSIGVRVTIAVAISVGVTVAVAVSIGVDIAIPVAVTASVAHTAPRVAASGIHQDTTEEWGKGGKHPPPVAVHRRPPVKGPYF